MRKVPALELRNVSYALDGRTILDSVDWSVRPGEHWAILGPNGSGKTTLLRIACGFLWPNAGGEVKRNGETLVNLPELRKSIGWVTASLAGEIPRREPALQTVVSGKYAQMGLFSWPWNKPTRSDFKRAEKYLAQMGAARLKRQEFGTLSQGEQQKVMIARARMTRPYLVLLDEPCAGVNPSLVDQLRDLLVELNKVQGGSFVVIEHNMDFIMKLCPHVICMVEGRVLAEGPPQAVQSNRQVLEAYLGN